jgi:hypothetical protein
MHSLEWVPNVGHNSKVGAVMEMRLKLDDEVRVNIDLPAAVRRKLARQSVQMDTDLQSLIRQILEREFVREGYGL